MLSKNVQLVIRDALMEAHRRRHDLLTVERGKRACAARAA